MQNKSNKSRNQRATNNIQLVPEPTYNTRHQNCIECELKQLRLNQYAAEKTFLGNEKNKLEELVQHQEEELSRYRERIKELGEVYNETREQAHAQEQQINFFREEVHRLIEVLEMETRRKESLDYMRKDMEDMLEVKEKKIQELEEYVREVEFLSRERRWQVDSCREDWEQQAEKVKELEEKEDRRKERLWNLRYTLDGAPSIGKFINARHQLHEFMSDNWLWTQPN